LSRNKKKCPLNTGEGKLITGDSHARGYAAEIPNGLGKDYEVIGTVCLENITSLADREVSTVGRSDTVIVMGGANDICKHEANIGIEYSEKFINSWQNTNIMCE